MIFDTKDRMDMHIAADFRFLPKGGFLTLGITEHLIAELYFNEMLPNIIDRIIERRETCEATNAK